MDISQATPLLGGLSAQAFMRRHWQKRPLLVRQAMPGVAPPLPAAALFALAADEGVESRLVEQTASGWRMRQGPLPRRALPPLARPGWTLLVQGLDAHVQAAHDLLARFRFVPDARLDDLMVSYASDGGGVGPHFDSYDVFLLQVEGRRRWRIGRQRDLELEPGLPLKILHRFEPEHEWVLEPGDMLYLPPRWAHDGVAVGPCMTCSIGFRAGGPTELARGVLQALADGLDAAGGERPYADRGQPATEAPGRIPASLTDFAAEAVRRALGDRRALSRAVGEWLSEPKPGIGFALRDEPEAWPEGRGARLDRRTRMLYDDAHVFVNGEAYRAAGRDAAAMRRLADARVLAPRELGRLSPQARSLLLEWYGAGWIHDDEPGAGWNRPVPRLNGKVIA